MPRYFVDFTHNDAEIVDTVGQVLDSELAARREAVKALAEISAEEIPRDGPLLLTATVFNESRKTIFVCSVRFDFEVSHAQDGG